MPVLPEPAPIIPTTWGPCTAWATVDEACGPCTEETADLEAWITVASELLFELSGQRFPGVCSDTVNPCAQTCGGDGVRRYDDLVAPTHGWRGLCGCGTACTCTTYSELVLTGWPLVSVEEVSIDGAIIDPSAYVVHDWARLARIDGSAWPACSDDFEITFTYGAMPPYSGVKAAAVLGCQLALACAGSSDCRLPQRVQSITRQGVSMVLLDPFSFFDDGRTGLYDVDLFLRAFGPKAKADWPALIANPDLHAKVRRTTG